MHFPFQSLLTRMLEIILKEVKGADANEALAAPRALALQTARKKSAEQEANAQTNRGGSSVDCKIWPWDMGMGFGPNSGLRVRC